MLLLGSFPGVASLQARAYYAHPRNQFWPILGAILDVPMMSLPYEERLAQLRRHRIALWDTVGHCQRRGSLDSNIRHAEANAFDALLPRMPGLRGVAFNGQLAARSRPYFEQRGLATAILPSTSPAHASLDVAQKLQRWREALLAWLTC